GKLFRGRTGIARMVLEAKVPVVPVAMIDTEKVQPLGQKYPKIHRVGVRVGEQLDFSRFAGMEGERVVLRAVADQIIYNIKKLSNQQYEDVYASTIRNRLARAEG
ncbi:MAG: 1-acyl-sn-glycerol-3-phosphate acyltransferase, partial [Aquiluna sp.]